MGTDKLMAEINRYCSPYSILVITPGRLLRLYCPFKVRVIFPVKKFNPGEILKVSQVLLTHDLYMVYMINKEGYFYYHFAIIVE